MDSSVCSLGLRGPVSTAEGRARGRFLFGLGPEAALMCGGAVCSAKLFEKFIGRLECDLVTADRPDAVRPYRRCVYQKTQRPERHQDTTCREAGRIIN